MPVRAIKTTTISILALGLLAGSAVGAAAQDADADGTERLVGRARARRGRTDLPVEETPA